MLFTSISFLYYFLPIVIILYFIVPKKFKNFILFLSSIFFYFWIVFAWLCRCFSEVTMQRRKCASYSPYDYAERVICALDAI